MKKFFPGLLALPLLIAAQEIPSSITVTCGKTDGRCQKEKDHRIGRADCRQCRFPAEVTNDHGVNGTV